MKYRGGDGDMFPVNMISQLWGKHCVSKGYDTYTPISNAIQDSIFVFGLGMGIRCSWFYLVPVSGPQ